MFLSSTLEASVFMGKNHSDNLNSIKNTGKDLTLKQMFKISEQLMLEQSDEILGVSQISWEILHRNSYLWSMMKKSSSLVCKDLRILRFCVVSWKSDSEPNIKYCLGATVGMVQRSITMQNFGHNRRRTDGISVEYFPRIHHIGACP